MRWLMLQIQNIDVIGVGFVLGDMDGTIVRCTAAINQESTSRVLARRGVVIDDAIYSEALGRERKEGFRRILRRCRREDLIAEIETLAAEKNEEANMLRRGLRPTDVPAEDRVVLTKLRECGLKIALGTSSRNALDTLNRVQLTSVFDVIVTGNEVTREEAADKTQIWRLALSYFDARGDQAIVLEDSQQGVDCAVALGCGFSVGVGPLRLHATVHVPRLGDLDVRVR
jgi:beta-phosphoglucomutase-like phosphatase (HAD superfamily)